jgi:hypothetical protein
MDPTTNILGVVYIPKITVVVVVVVVVVVIADCALTVTDVLLVVEVL